jgi:hypothetical protein
MRSCNFWRLMFNKVTSRSYGYFFKFTFFLGREMESSN